MGKEEEQKKDEVERQHTQKNQLGSGGIRTHASEETGALIQRLRPLGHATHDKISGDHRAIGH